MVLFLSMLFLNRERERGEPFPPAPFAPQERDLSLEYRVLLAKWAQQEHQRNKEIKPDPNPNRKSRLEATGESGDKLMPRRCTSALVC